MSQVESAPAGEGAAGAVQGRVIVGDAPMISGPGGPPGADYRPRVLLAVEDAEAEEIREALRGAVAAGDVTVVEVVDGTVPGDVDLKDAVMVAAPEAIGGAERIATAVRAGVTVFALTERADDQAVCMPLVAAGVYGIATDVAELLPELAAVLDLEPGEAPP